MRGPGLLVIVGLVLLLSTAAIGTPADADLWGHLTFGRDILTRGDIVHPDRYSFTSDRPWVNHEWLSEISFAAVYGLAGSTGLVALKVAVIAAILGLVWWHLRRFRPSAPVITALVTLAFVGTFWRTHTIRPQLFSVLFFAILLITLAHASHRRWGLFLLPLLMAVWVNFHGGWIVGIGVLGLWTAAQIIDRRLPGKERLLFAGIGLTALGATLVNPYGVGMWTFLGETVRLGRADIEEWGSVLTHPVALGGPWLLAFAAAGYALWRASGPRRYDYIAIAALLAFASFRVSRLDAFFTLVVVILLAPRSVAPRSDLGQTGIRPRSDLDQTGIRPRSGPGLTPGVIAITVIAVAAMLVPAARLIGPYATCLTIAGPWVPEVEAGQFIRVNQLKGRMLTWFDWGEYAIWHFFPNLQVSIDGRRETVYTDDTIQSHRRFYAADATALPYLGTLNPDYIWVPNRLPIASRLPEAGWMTIFRGPVSSVFARAGAGPFQQVNSPPSTAMRCFPGP